MAKRGECLVVEGSLFGLPLVVEEHGTNVPPKKNGKEKKRKEKEKCGWNRIVMQYKA